MKPTAIGCKYFKKSSLGLVISNNDNSMAKLSMSILAGNTQIANVIKAKLGPPILYPMAVMVWVDVGPGNILHKEFSSFNSSSVT
jgi:hypothetical protein